MSISGVANNFVELNTIAFNGEEGVQIQAAGQNLNNANGNRVLTNSIFSNDGLGIILGSGGSPIPYDPGDADDGANKKQNFPVLTSAKTSKKKGATITGTLDSTPGKTFAVQLFSNPSGGDEGKTFLGETSVSTDGSGDASFSFKPKGKVLKGEAITATATDPESNTSEFSEPKAAGKK